MAEVYTTMDQLKQATVNSLYNVINNDFGDNSVYSNIKCRYSNGSINSDSSITCVLCYVSSADNINCITMANLPYAISWLRNPRKVGLADAGSSNLLMSSDFAPNDLCVLLGNGSYCKGGLIKYCDGCLSIVNGSNNDYCIKLCNSGYSRSSLCKSISKATCSFDSNTATFTVNTGYVGTKMTCPLDKSSLTGDVTLTPSNSSVTISAGYTGGGTVKYVNYERICTHSGSGSTSIHDTYELIGQCRYLFVLHEGDLDQVSLCLDSYKLVVGCCCVYFSAFPETYIRRLINDTTVSYDYYCNMIFSSMTPEYYNYDGRTLYVNIIGDGSSSWCFSFYDMGSLDMPI